MFARCPSVACGRRNIPIHPIRQCLRCFALDRSEVERVSGRYSVYCFGIDLVLKVTKIGGHSQWVLCMVGALSCPGDPGLLLPGLGKEAAAFDSATRGAVLDHHHYPVGV